MAPIVLDNKILKVMKDKGVDKISTLHTSAYEMGLVSITDKGKMRPTYDGMRSAILRPTVNETEALMLEVISRALGVGVTDLYEVVIE